MASILAFQTQIASVMEVLANAAVVEICRLVEDSYAELQLEISQSQKENSLLKKKLKMIEIRESFYRRAHKLRNASTHFTKPSVYNEVSGRIVRVNVGSLSNKRDNEVGAALSGEVSVRPETLEQSEGDEEADVLIIKEEIPDIMRGEQSEREAGITENCEKDTQNRSPGVFPSQVNSENFIDQNTVQHCFPEPDGVQPDLLKDENSEINFTGEDPKLLSDESRMEGHSETETNLQPVNSYAAWDSRRFEATANNLSYTESECNSGPSLNQYLICRGNADPMCSYTAQMDSNNLSVPDLECQLTHSDETGLEKVVISRSDLPSFTPCFSLKQSDTPYMQRKDKFICKYCGKLFSQPSTLLLHQKLHNRERLHNCTLCGKRFSQASSLKRHQSIHRGEKPFRCLHCGKQFSDQSNLKKHLNVHTGEKPYGCSQCGKMFNQSSNLKTHMKIHTREKPFSCERCGQMFAYKNSLVKHQQKNCLYQ